jgi:PQQ-like domain
MKSEFIAIGVVNILTLLACRTSPASQAPQGTALWTYSAPGPGFISSSPALGADGTVYVASGGSLCAVTNSGLVASNKWTFPVCPTFGLSPSIGPDGTLYFGVGQCDLYSVRPDGSLGWVHHLQPEFQYQISFRSTPAVGVDGTIYFVAGGRLYAVSPPGSVIWECVLDNSSAGGFTSPALGPDGTIYIGSTYAASVYAINPDGTRNWSYQLPSGCAESAALGNTLYIAAFPLYAFNLQGTNLWSAGDLFQGSPSIGTRGDIYVADTGRTLHRITAGGQTGWQAITSSPALFSPTTPAVDAGGNIYYSCSNSVWMLNPQGQARWNLTEPGDPGPGGEFALTSPIIGPDGTLYVALGRTLYAIATGTNGPAKSPWPMYQQNCRHTGKVEGPVVKQPRKRSDANFEFQLYAQQLGLTYTVQSSADLDTWSSLTSFVANTLPVEVVDLSASNSTARFYRAFSSP